MTVNRTVLIDIMELNGKTVLHVMNESTRFGAAAFMTDSETGEATSKL